MICIADPPDVPPSPEEWSGRSVRSDFFVCMVLGVVIPLAECWTVYGVILAWNAVTMPFGWQSSDAGAWTAAVWLGSLGTVTVEYMLALFAHAKGIDPQCQNDGHAAHDVLLSGLAAGNVATLLGYAAYRWYC